MIGKVKILRSDGYDPRIGIKSLLTAKQKAVWDAHEEGLSIRQTARLLGISESSVVSRLRLAKENLQGELNEQRQRQRE